MDFSDFVDMLDWKTIMIGLLIIAGLALVTSLFAPSGNFMRRRLGKWGPGL